MLIKSVELKNVNPIITKLSNSSKASTASAARMGTGKARSLNPSDMPYSIIHPIKNRRFRRHGEKSGFIAVTVEGKDEIEYTIYRKLGGSDYYIKRLSARSRKKDVTDWIASNLLNNVRSHEDMPSIFENAVGVPQAHSRLPSC